MKKTGFKLFAVSLALCFFFGACNFNINGGRELAEVRVGGGGGRAANPETGLPIFDGSNTTITISDASGRLIAEGPLPLSAEVVVGVEIVIKATVQTASGTWSRTKTHTVKAGINDIDLELSKTPNVVGNFFFDVVETVPLSGVKLRLKFRNGKTFPDTIRMGGNYHKPVTARDSIGRLYLLYLDDSEKKFTRFDVDGNEDMGFQTAVALQLPLPNGISDIDNIAVDQDDNYIFLFNGVNVYCLKENAHNHFTCSNGSSLTALDPSISTVSAVAVYNGTLFFTVPLSVSLPQVNKLFAYKAELSGTTPPALTLSNKGDTQLPKVRQNSAFDNNHTECTDLFADEDGVYCLLNEQKLDSGMLYALGQLVRYTYTGSSFADETKVGLSSDNVSNNNPVVAFDAQYFSNPIGFIGYDEENIYIADDGVGIANGKEGWRVTGEKNRIAAFNRKTGTLTFTDTDATWYAYHAAYPSKKTPALLWEKRIYMHYWTSTDGAEAFSGENKLFEGSSYVQPTDMFCYDQDGNLYIVYRDNSNVYFVRRFILGVNGYVKDNDKSLGSSFDISAVAVDISDGKKTLYYSYKTVSNNWFVKSLVWNTDFSSAAFPTSPYEIQTALSEITALAANKDGVFVATKEQAVLTAPYTLKVAKYKKGSPVQDGVITVVSASPAENPSPHPATGDYECYEEAVRDLQVIDGVLYGISSKTTESRKYVSTHHETDVFKNSSKLYKIGATASTLSGIEKTIGKDANDAAQTGYGFCRFIAVKYDEAERIRLIIASDGAWGTNGSGNPPGDPENTDKVLEYDLAGNLLVERNSGGSFSQKLTHIVGTGFSWY